MLFLEVSKYIVLILDEKIDEMEKLNLWINIKNCTFRFKTLDEKLNFGSNIRGQIDI